MSIATELERTIRRLEVLLEDAKKTLAETIHERDAEVSGQKVTAPEDGRPVHLYPHNGQWGTNGPAGIHELTEEKIVQLVEKATMFGAQRSPYGTPRDE